MRIPTKLSDFLLVVLCGFCADRQTNKHRRTQANRQQW